MSYHAFKCLIVLFLLKILSISCDKPAVKAPAPKYEWDLLIFTQRWPMTACSQWEEKGRNNTCAFPDPKDLWTIHGIWPTKAGTKGPANCNNTWHFNASLIEPILSELEEYWTNVEKNTKLTSLWQHEWSKHGTCATVLPQLNNEYNYFKQGLDWIKQYNMKDVLSGQNVLPNQKGYSVQQIFDSIKNVLRKNPIIECVVDRRTKQSLISEIRICFDKGLNLMDCDTVKDLDEGVVKEGDVLSNCNMQKPIMYPDRIDPYTTTTVPTTMSSGFTSPLESLLKTRKHLIAFYRTIKLLIWATI